MLKRQSKKLAIALIFSLIATLFVGVGAASAANAVVDTGRIPTINVDVAAFTPAVLAPMYITEEEDAWDTFDDQTFFWVALPAGIEWPATLVADTVVAQTLVGNTWVAATSTDVTVARSTASQLYVKIDDTNDDLRTRLVITPNIVVNGYGETTINATIRDVQGSIPTGDWLIARTSRGGTSSVAASKPTVGESTQTLGTVRITEVGTNTFKNAAVGPPAVANTVIELTLPQNMEWVANPVVNFRGGFSGAGAPSITNGANERVKVLTFSNFGGARVTPGVIEIVPTNAINIKSRAAFGDIELKIEGSGGSDITTETIVIGTYADFVVSISATDDKVLVSGQIEQEAGVLTIKESIKATLAPSRNIEITMPKGVKINEADVKLTKGAVAMGGTTVDVDRILIPITASSTSAATIEINFKELNIAPDFKGDIVVQVGGRAGVEGEATIGSVLQALTPAPNKDEVKIGFQNQKVSNFVFTEAEAGAVLEGEVAIIAPPGVFFSSTNKPVVEVTEGNMELKSNSVRIDNSTRSLIFEVDAESTRVSTITISNIYLNVDRTVPVGPITFDVEGATEESIAESFDTPNGKDDPYFDYGLAFSFVGANCVTPASTTTAAVSQFVIGSTTYTLNDVENTMPTAPYIKDNRTYLVLRFAAMAMGITEQNIMWDPDNRTVTLMKDGVVVQLVIGSKVMRVNGADITLDVAPEISNGYTMLPIGVIANAFSHIAEWDAATQTVTISPLERNVEVAF